MSDWLKIGDFVLHSGKPTPFKIECDALTDTEIETFATIIADRFAFYEVFGIPRGGARIAAVLEKYRIQSSCTRLIVDDVLTTGESMEDARQSSSDIGVVLFSRGKCPKWIHPVFQLWSAQH